MAQGNFDYYDRVLPQRWQSARDEARGQQRVVCWHAEPRQGRSRAGQMQQLPRNAKKALCQKL